MARIGSHLALVLMLFVMGAQPTDGRRPIGAEPAYRVAPSRAKQRSQGMYEVAFTDAEESELRARHDDTAEMIAARMDGRSASQVQRRCLELGLRCGGNVAPPEHNSEKWRAVARP